jgi:hypothetical protein
VSAHAKVSMTTTPSSPMTNPALAPAGALALLLSMAAHAFGPTCFSVYGDSAGCCARSRDVAHNRTIAATCRAIGVPWMNGRR